MNLKNSINPINDDGSIDHRYVSVTSEIIERAGQGCIRDLSDFYNLTKESESKYELAGLRLVSAFFQQDMERWQRNGLKKRLRECLGEIGFRPSKISKLITAGEFVASEMSDNKSRRDDTSTDEWDFFESTKEEKEQSYLWQVKYLRDHGLTGLYQLARMDWKGLVEARHKYKENGDIPLTTRELEKLQKRHPAKTKERRGRPARFCRSQEKQDQKVSTQLDQVRGLTPIEPTDEVNPQQIQLQPTLASGEISNAELVEQFTGLAKAIDWSAIRADTEARRLLNSTEETLRLIADLAHESQYSPVI
jgi:hypothetical protein